MSSACLTGQQQGRFKQLAIAQICGACAALVLKTRRERCSHESTSVLFGKTLLLCCGQGFLHRFVMGPCLLCRRGGGSWERSCSSECHRLIELGGAERAGCTPQYTWVHKGCVKQTGPITASARNSFASKRLLHIWISYLVWLLGRLLKLVQMNLLFALLSRKAWRVYLLPTDLCSVTSTLLAKVSI